MKPLIRDLWLCCDCTLCAVNGDLPEDSTIDRDADIEEGLKRLGPGLVPDDYEDEQAECGNCGWHGDSSKLVTYYLPESDEQGCPHCANTEEISIRDNGREEFSWFECDCCGSTLGGSRTRFALLGPDEPEAQGILNF